MLLQVRPRRITILASIAATLVIGSMVVIGLLLRDTNEGVTFRVNDQIGLIGIGLVLGGVIMTAARPRLRADQNGMSVRNVFGETFVPWPLVVRVAFPPGAHWAQLQMPDDEVKAVMAIQAMDRGRAVTALERLRALHQRYAPPPPVPSVPAESARPDGAKTRSGRSAGWRSSTGRRRPSGTVTSQAKKNSGERKSR